MIFKMKSLRVILPVVLMVSLVTHVAESATGPFGVNLNNGYFSGSGYTGSGWAFVPFGASPYTNITGLGGYGDNLADFEAAYQARLFDAASTVDQGRAAAEIDIMLGQTGPSFGGSIASGIAYAQGHFNNWKNLMALYDSGTVPGYSVQWNVSYNLGSLSGEWVAVGAKGVNDANFGSCNAFEFCSGDLMIVSPNPDNSVENVVRFNVNGQLWLIPTGCACMTGTATSLSIPVSSSISLTKTATAPTLPVGGSMTYGITAQETVSAPLNSVTVTDAIPANYVPIAGSCSPGPCSISGQNVTWTFTQPGDAAVLSAIAGAGQALKVDVNAITAGSGIVNTATGTATDSSGNSVPVNPASVTTDITGAASTTYPSVVGLNSDIHAGGGVCDAPLNPAGFINTNPNADSYGQYVVSASGLASSFGSNNDASDSSDLLGPSGSYTSLCRPNLYQHAKDNPPVGLNTLPGGTYDLGTAFNGSPNVTIVNGKAVAYIAGNANIQGTYNQNRPLTLVVTGDVTITGNALVTGGTNASNLPSLGILTNGAINISGAATQVDAMMFSDNTIDTCYEAAAPQCSNTLTVKGFVMASDLQLHRLGP